MLKRTSGPYLHRARTCKWWAWQQQHSMHQSPRSAPSPRSASKPPIRLPPYRPPPQTRATPDRLTSWRGIDAIDKTTQPPVNLLVKVWFVAMIAGSDCVLALLRRAPDRYLSLRTPLVVAQ